MQYPDATVIVTCYNLQDYIRAALQSVHDQTYLGNIQTIVVDDASSDGSVELIRQFENVRLIRNDRNRGVLASLMTGFEHAKADLIFMLDGDDVWEKDKLAKCVEYFVRDRNVGFVTHDITYIGSDGAKLDRNSKASRRAALFDPAKATAEIRRGILYLEDYVWLGSAFGVRRSLVKLREFEHLIRSEGFEEVAYQDWPLAFWIAAQGDVSIEYIPLPLMKYRVHGQNHSGGSAADHKKMAKNSKKLLSTMRLIQKISELNGHQPKIRRRVLSYVSHSQFMVALYEGRRVGATAWFIQFALGPRRAGAGRLKELARLLIVATAGPRLGTKIIRKL